VIVFVDACRNGWIGPFKLFILSKSKIQKHHMKQEKRETRRRRRETRNRNVKIEKPTK
jgi:hypothetical protein